MNTTVLIVALLLALLAGLVLSLLGYHRFPFHRILRSKTRLQAAFDSVDDPLAIVDANYRIRRVNRAYAALVNHPYQYILGKPCYEVLRGRSSVCEDCRLDEVVKCGEKRVTERSPHPHSSRGGVASFTFYPFVRSLDNIIMVVEHIRDITELEHLKDALETRNRELSDTARRLRAEQLRTEEELNVARQIQIGIMPQGLPEVEGVRIDATYHPIAAVGGDLYDFITFSPRRLGLFIGDASGHGLASAFIGTMSKMVLYGHTQKEVPPARLLSLMNRDLISNIHSGHYLTCFWGVLDLENSTMTFARAGHPKPVAIEPDGTVRVFDSQGTFVGVLDNPEYEEKTVGINKGDRLYFFTDGIYEVVDPESELKTRLLGYRKFVRILAEYNSLPFMEVLPAVQERLSRYHYEDDYALILVEIKPDSA